VDRDQMLTNVMLYWLTGAADSSARIYYERPHADYWGTPPEPSTTPTALADSPHDNFIPLRHVAERTNNIVQWTQYERGGHFAAMEQPESLVDDIRTFFRRIRDQARGWEFGRAVRRSRDGAARTRWACRSVVTGLTTRSTVLTGRSSSIFDP
jgi:hypothetical protein